MLRCGLIWLSPGIVSAALYCALSDEVPPVVGVAVAREGGVAVAVAVAVDPDVAVARGVAVAVAVAVAVPRGVAVAVAVAVAVGGSVGVAVGVPVTAPGSAPNTRTPLSYTTMREAFTGVVPG